MTQPPGTQAARRVPILNADDFGLSDGVSRAIESLAQRRRLSAISAMTNMPDWRASARRLAALRDQVAVGVHLTLTLGEPLGAMARLAPAGVLPTLPALLRQIFFRHASPSELRGEIGRQLDAFETEFGFPPDHIDGHQHAHVLPAVRAALLAELSARYTRRKPLLRVPVVALRARAAPGGGRTKGLVTRGLSAGFARAAVAAGFPVNVYFGGFSDFDTAVPFAAELDAQIRDAGCGRGYAIVMCHPGFPDAALAALDPVVDRRRQEYDALSGATNLPDRIWHPVRAVDGLPIDWTAEARA